MNKFENKLYELMIYDENNRWGESKLCRIDFKEEVCKKILRYLTEEDIKVDRSEQTRPGEESYVTGNFILEKYKIEIRISVDTEFICAVAKYLGEEEVNEKSRRLVSFKGEFSKKIILDGYHYETIGEILLVRTIEFIKDLNKSCNNKLIDNEDIGF